jgi:hypothetical protein
MRAWASPCPVRSVSRRSSKLPPTVTARPGVGQDPYVFPHNAAARVAVQPARRYSCGHCRCPCADPRSDRLFHHCWRRSESGPLRLLFDRRHLCANRRSTRYDLRGHRRHRRSGGAFGARPRRGVPLCGHHPDGHFAGDRRFPAARSVDAVRLALGGDRASSTRWLSSFSSPRSRNWWT